MDCTCGLSAEKGILGEQFPHNHVHPWQLSAPVSVRWLDKPFFCFKIYSWAAFQQAAAYAHFRGFILPLPIVYRGFSFSCCDELSVLQRLLLYRQQSGTAGSPLILEHVPIWFPNQPLPWTVLIKVTSDLQLPRSDGGLLAIPYPASQQWHTPSWSPAFPGLQNTTFPVFAGHAFSLSSSNSSFPIQALNVSISWS